jgi:hypothetical protein
MAGKKFAIIGLVVVLVLGGSAFGVYTWKMNAVAFWGVSLPMQGVEAEQRDQWVETFEEIAAEEAVVKKIVEVSDYQNLMGLDSEQAAVADLTKRMKIKYRPRKNTIEIGLTGIRKEIEELKLIAPKIYQVCATVLAANDGEFADFSSQKRE